MRCYLLTCCLILLSALGYAQNSSMPKLDVTIFKHDHHSVDTAAKAIVLYEFGRSEIEVSESQNSIGVNHYCHVRIKILKKDGDKHATVEIPVYKYGSDFERVTEIKGSTYNLVDGQIQVDELKKDAIFTEKVSAQYQIIKFTLPNIQENSIIEYSYRTNTPAIWNLRTWYFQDEIPKIHSEYVAVIPSVFEYNVTLKGHYAISDLKTARLSEHFLLNGKRFDCSRMTYIMKDIPAFKEEDYMLAPINYISAVNFELKTFHEPSGAIKNYTRVWKDVDTELLNDKDFGGQIKNKSVYGKLLPSIISPDSSKLFNAKKIYNYIQQNIVWNKTLGKYAENGIKDALEKKKGNIGDINLSLVSALNNADIEAYPVIISTRNNGIPNVVHPVLSDFNAVIVAALIDGKTYLLDASDKYLTFGLLSLRSINERGRIIYSKQSSDWIELKNTIPTKKTYNIFATISEDGKMKGKIEKYYSGLEAYIQRSEIEKFPTLEEYEENVIEKSSGLKILSNKIKNLTELDNPLVESMEFEFDMRENFNATQILLNPILYERQRKNPFNLSERNFHVDLGSARAEQYNINITFPEGYKLESFPKSTSYALPEGAAKFIYRSSFSDNVLMVQQVTNLNQAIYSPEEYFHLKEFFSLLIQHQNTDFLFKKI